MKVYYYNEYTKEYTHSEEAFLDPEETRLQGKEVYLLPANATLEPAPQFNNGHIAVWDGKKWKAVKDNRGKEYWLDTDEYGTPARVMEDLGDFPTNAVFEAPAKPLEIAKTEKLEELKSERDKKEVEPVEYNGNIFDFDDKARERINNAITALSLNEGASLEWTLADNTSTTVTADDLRNVIGVVAMRSNDLHIAYREAKAKVETATTIEEVEVIILEV